MYDPVTATGRGDHLSLHFANIVLRGSCIRDGFTWRGDCGMSVNQVGPIGKALSLLLGWIYQCMAEEELINSTLRTLVNKLEIPIMTNTRIPVTRCSLQEKEDRNRFQSRGPCYKELQSIASLLKIRLAIELRIMIPPPPPRDHGDCDPTTNTPLQLLLMLK